METFLVQPRLICCEIVTIVFQKENLTEPLYFLDQTLWDHSFHTSHLSGKEQLLSSVLLSPTSVLL